MLKILKILFIVIGFSFLLNACKERIDDLDLKSETARMVVDGHIGTDTTTYFIMLSRTSDYFDSDMSGNAISGAIVIITELETGRIIQLTEEDTMPGRYKTAENAYGIQGYSYRLDVSNVDLNRDGNITSYTATDLMPYIPEVNDSSFIKVPYGISLMNEFLELETKDTGFNVCLFIKEPPTHEYYAFIMLKNHQPVNDTLTQYDYMDDADIPNNGNYFNGYPLFFMGLEDSATGRKTFKNKTKYNYKQNDTLGVEIRSISRAYYTYTSDVNRIYGGTNPLFGNTPSNVRGNVSGGAIGFFASYPKMRLEAVCDTAYTNAKFKKERSR